MVDEGKPGVPEYIMCSIQQGSSPPRVCSSHLHAHLWRHAYLPHSLQNFLPQTMVGRNQRINNFKNFWIIKFLYLQIMKTIKMMNTNQKRYWILICNCSTYNLKLNTGVPQGSVLGSLLFAIYVNDISLCLDHDVSHLMYADDSKFIFAAL